MQRSYYSFSLWRQSVMSLLIYPRLLLAHEVQPVLTCRIPKRTFAVPYSHAEDYTSSDLANIRHLSVLRNTLAQ
jgi:hypothetical protein